MEQTTVDYRRGIPAKMSSEATFYRRYITLLRRQALRILGDGAAAELVAQRVMNEGLRARHLWTARRQATYLFAQVTRHATHALRRFPPPPPPPGAKLSTNPDLLRHRLRDYPLGRSLAAVCVFLSWMSPDETAELLDLSARQVYQRLRHFDQHEDARMLHGCLSGLQISLIVSGATAPQPKQAKHVDNCRDCRMRLNDEEQAMRQAADEDLPPSQVQHGRLWRWMTTVSMGLALACTALGTGVWLTGRTSQAATLPTPPRPTLGAVPDAELGIYASVLRDGHFVINDQPLQALSDLHPGDRLRLRLSDGRNRLVRVDSVHNHHKQHLYRGTLDGEVRIAHGVVLASDTQLQVSVCDKPRGSCVNRSYTF